MTAGLWSDEDDREVVGWRDDSFFLGPPTAAMLQSVSGAGAHSAHAASLRAARARTTRTWPRMVITKLSCFLFFVFRMVITKPPASDSWRTYTLVLRAPVHTCA